jgi:hypothetical protein
MCERLKIFLKRPRDTSCIGHIISGERKESALHIGLSVSEKMMTLTRPKLGWRDQERQEIRRNRLRGNPA